MTSSGGGGYNLTRFESPEQMLFAGIPFKLEATFFVTNTKIKMDPIVLYATMHVLPMITDIITKEHFFFGGGRWRGTGKYYFIDF